MSVGPWSLRDPVVELRWTRLDWSDIARTFPPHGEPVLVCDEIGAMAVCACCRLSNDFMISFRHHSGNDEPVTTEDGFVVNLEDAEHYFPRPVAWMPLPFAPYQILESDDVDHEVTMKVFDALSTIEPILRQALSGGSQP